MGLICDLYVIYMVLICFGTDSVAHGWGSGGVGGGDEGWQGPTRRRIVGTTMQAGGLRHYLAGALSCFQTVSQPKYVHRAAR